MLTNFDLNRIEQNKYNASLEVAMQIESDNKKIEKKSIWLQHMEDVVDDILKRHKAKEKIEKRTIYIKQNINRSSKKYLTREEIDQIERFADKYELILRDPRYVKEGY